MLDDKFRLRKETELLFVREMLFDTKNGKITKIWTIDETCDIIMLVFSTYLSEE